MVLFGKVGFIILKEGNFMGTFLLVIIVKV